MINQFLLAFVGYFAILALIAYVVHRRNRTATDFMLGGRTTNYFVTAIAAQASDMSSWLFLAFPAAIYMNGVFEYWTAIGLIVFMYINWTYIAPKIRVATQHYNSLTLTSYLSSRFNDSRGFIGFIAALFSIFFFSFYIASGLVGVGRLLEATFGLPFYTGIFIALGTALIYTLVGGFLAVAWCNVFKGLFMLTIILIVPAYTFFLIGNTQSIVAAAHEYRVSLSLFPADKNLLTSLLLTCGWGLGYFGQPHILLYFMSIDDVKKIRYAKYVGMAWMVIALAAAGLIGLLSLAYFDTHLALPETLFIKLVTAIFSPFLAGIALCGIFAASLASMNNHILLSASMIAEDVYQRWWKKNQHVSRQELTYASQAGAFGISLAAAYISLHSSLNIYHLVNYAWSGLGSSFGPILLASLYIRAIPYTIALASIVIGGLTAACWPFFGTGILPLVPGFFLASSILILGSLFNKRHV